MKSVRHSCIRILLVLASASELRAEWRTDAGYYALAAELVAALPTGAGIPVLQCEADLDDVKGAPYVYLPQTMTSDPWSGTDGFAGKTFHLLGGAGEESYHANLVCAALCTSTSISPGVTAVCSHEALQFYLAMTGGSTPPSFAGLGTVQNHSWIALPKNSTEAAGFRDMLRRYDLMLDRDNILGVVALNNGEGNVPHLMAPSYNAVCAGVRSGSHSTSGTLADQDGPGRMKPDLVVDQPFTSLAAPSIASAAALLYDAIRPGFPDADHPQAVKAILLAGASKSRLPAWQRQTAAKPYDNVFGAGELNVFNAYHILARGRQPYSASIEVAPLGWDFTTASSASARRYFFTVPAGRMANTFSAALTWHRNIQETTFDPTVPDLNLKLFASTAFSPEAEPIDQSVSAADNVEHLWLRNLPPGQYMIEIASDTDNQSYALAWEAQLGSGPVMSPRRDAGGSVVIDLSEIDPFVTYTVETSPTLGTTASWTSAGTFRTADAAPSLTHTWQDAGTPYPGARFYRLRWISVR